MRKNQPNQLQGSDKAILSLLLNIIVGVKKIKEKESTVYGLKFYLRIFPIFLALLLCVLIVLVAYESLFRSYYSIEIFLFLLLFCLFFLWRLLLTLSVCIILTPRHIAFHSSAFHISAPWDQLEKIVYERNYFSSNRWKKIPILMLKGDAIPDPQEAGEQAYYLRSWFFRFFGNAASTGLARQIPIPHSIISQKDWDGNFGQMLRKNAPQLFEVQAVTVKKQK